MIRNQESAIINDVMIDTEKVIKPKRFSKKKFDLMIEEIIDLKEKKKAIETRLDELIFSAEGFYKKGRDTAETITGDKYEMTKVPRNMGRNNYNVELVRNYMAKIPAHLRTGLIKTREEVDPKVLDSLVKLGILTADQADKARNDKWTYSSRFKKHINTDNIIEFKK